MSLGCACRRETVRLRDELNLGWPSSTLAIVPVRAAARQAKSAKGVHQKVFVNGSS
jgi:hypothetical protein